MVMETPGPQCVGREFVRQYYTLLHEAPMHLHRFYSHNSCFVHGGVEKPGEEQPPVMGQADIHKKIVSLNFRDCHAKIRQVDSQATVGSAVVVQVTGELSNNGQPMRRFMQTFVLVPQTPKKYYVHNDIFRYQDEVFHDDTDTENQEEAVDSDSNFDAVESDHESTENPPHEEPVQPVQPFYESAPTQQPPVLSNGTAHAEEPVETPTAAPAKPQETEPLKVEPEEEEEELEEEEPPKEEIPYESATAKPEEKIAEAEQEQPVPQAAQPKTWAALFPVSNPNSVATPAVAPVSSKPPAPGGKPVDMKPASETGGPGPQPQRLPRPQRERPPRDGSRGHGGDSDEMSRRSADRRYPDSHQIFVGNLPHNVTEKEVKDFFEQYGKVVELRINKKSGSPNVPNYGFVVFSDDEPVQRILNQKAPFQLPNGHRLNVEEKKQRGEGGRPGSGTRAGGRGGSMSGRGGPGGPGRGGGRGGPPGGPLPPRTGDNRSLSSAGSGGPRGGGFSGPRR